MHYFNTWLFNYISFIYCCDIFEDLNCERKCDEFGHSSIILQGVQLNKNTLMQSGLVCKTQIRKATKTQ